MSFPSYSKSGGLSLLKGTMPRRSYHCGVAEDPDQKTYLEAACRALIYGFVGMASVLEEIISLIRTMKSLMWPSVMSLKLKMS